MKNKDIPINIAYNQVISYDQSGNIVHVNSNLPDYDIHPWHTANCSGLKEIEDKYSIKIPYILQQDDNEFLVKELDRFYSQALEIFLDNSEGTFKPVLLEDVYQSKERFIYPLVLYNNELFYKYESIDIDSRVVERVLENKAKICFLQPTEGYFGSSDIEFEWLNTFCKKFKFRKENVLVITSNLKALFNYNFLVSIKAIQDTFTVYPFSYFQHDIWFQENTVGKVLNKESHKAKIEHFEKSLQSSKLVKEKHFLSFNRVSRPHRVLLFGEIQTNKNLKDKTIITLGKDLTNNPEGFYDTVELHLEDDYKFSKQKILNFYKNYDSTQQHTYDVSNLEINQASNLNTDAHNKTLVNIVTETLTDPYTVFFSEKTFKPIFCAQPFVLFGNPLSLQKLKEYGFQTFDKWWDESYDEELNLTKRLEKIVETLEFISKWDLQKCNKVLEEMESIFINNFNVLTSTEKVLKLHDDLRNFN